MLQEYYDKGLHYAAIVALSSLAQLGLLMQQMKRSMSTAVGDWEIQGKRTVFDVTEFMQAASKVSMICIGTLATLDCFFSLFHLSVGVLFGE